MEALCDCQPSRNEHYPICHRPANYTIQYLRPVAADHGSANRTQLEIDLPGPARPFSTGSAIRRMCSSSTSPTAEICIRGPRRSGSGGRVADTPDAGPQRPRSTRVPRSLPSRTRRSCDLQRASVSRPRSNRAAAVESLMAARTREGDLPPRRHQGHHAGRAGLRTGCRRLPRSCPCLCLMLSSVEHSRPLRQWLSRALDRPATSDGKRQEMASHAWAEAWIEGAGWQGFDVANQVRAARSSCTRGCGSRLPGRLPGARLHRGAATSPWGRVSSQRDHVPRNIPNERTTASDEVQQQQQQQQQQ